ncbi:MEDS domain-containing protein [Pseudonocardia acidicola]|uniref:MEDS domain-containing protein n=1 Tax=Pseudonocardia acidicola TaxID=2724939 RepID=A0ABX1S746_9PSEU|nr:hypothetical protein [Pseudonocardia acidicola]
MSSRNGAEADSATWDPRFGGAPLSVHDHVCAFFRGDDERDRLLLPFLTDGLRAGETCLCLTAEGQSAQLVQRVADSGTDVGRLAAVEPSETHLLSGSFQSDRMLELLDAWSVRVFAGDDDRRARIAGDMTWIRPLIRPSFLAELLRYEAEVTTWLAGHSLIAVCLYEMGSLGGDALMALTKCHSKVWLDGQVIGNPYRYAPEPMPQRGRAARER